MIRVNFSKSKESLTVLDEGNQVMAIWAWSRVRDELNGERPNPAKGKDVFFSETKDQNRGPAAMPRPFPDGTWNITAVEWNQEPFTAPVKIRTDAHQELDIWGLLPDGSYGQKTGEKVDDWGYLIHWPNGSNRTQGCTGTQEEADIIKLANYIEGVLKAQQQIPYTVTE